MRFITSLLLSTVLFSPNLMADDFILIPGIQAGPVTATTTEAELISLLGAEQVKRDVMALGEGEEAEVTSLFPGNKEKELQILWDIPFTKPLVVNVIGTAWKTKEGVILGISLKDLEKINQSSFELSGYGWDYEGSVLNYGSGLLSKYDNTLLVRFNDADAAQRVSESEFATILGDNSFSSDNQILQKMNPIITDMNISFTQPE